MFFVRFSVMGFNDIQTVALLGAHNVGFAHRAASGFFGPWTSQPFLFTNEYFVVFANTPAASSDASMFDRFWPANSITTNGSKVIQFREAGFPPLTGNEANVVFAGPINAATTQLSQAGAPVNTVLSPSCSSATVAAPVVLSPCPYMRMPTDSAANAGKRMFHADC